MTKYLTIHGRLPGMNEYTNAQRTNRYKGAKLKADAQSTVESEIQRQLKGVKLNPPIMILYRFYEKDKRRDLDNISGMAHKVIQDAMVTQGLIADDGWDYISGFSDEFWIDRNNPRIEIVIQEVYR